MHILLSLQSIRCELRHLRLVRTAEQLLVEVSAYTFPKATLCFLQEILSTHLAGVPTRQPARDAPLHLHVLARAKVNTRAIKIGLYGLLISGPLSHVLVDELQKVFAGKTGRAAKLGQIFASNLIISPIQAFCEFSFRFSLVLVISCCFC